MYPKFTTPKTLTAQEQGRLLRAVRAQGSRRDRAILSLALGTGLRLRELAGLPRHEGPLPHPALRPTLEPADPLPPIPTRPTRSSTRESDGSGRENLS